MNDVERSLRRQRLRGRLSALALVAAVALLAILTNRYHLETDWSTGQGNSLSDASRAVLDQLPERLSISAFAGDDALVRKRLRTLIRRYRRYKPSISVHFVDAHDTPQWMHDVPGPGQGSLLLEYQGRSQVVNRFTEQEISNALQRLARRGERWLVFLSGHGERKAHGQANHDLGNWVHELESKGFKVTDVNLAQNRQIPQNTGLLVLAGPQVDLLDGEVEMIKEYIAHGGNLLWLSDPGVQHGLENLSDSLGVLPSAGMVVDATTRLLGIASPSVAIVAAYDDTLPVTRGFDKITLFPQATAIDLLDSATTWQKKAVLHTTPKSWLEKGELQGSVSFDPELDRAGPVTIGVALERTRPEVPDTAVPEPGSGKQRVFVLGDGDFLSNSYLGNGGNLDLGVRLVSWLVGDDELVAVPARVTADRDLNLGPAAMMIIAIGLLFVLPLLLAGGGATIWWRRRRR